MRGEAGRQGNRGIPLVQRNGGGRKNRCIDAACFRMQNASKRRDGGDTEWVALLQRLARFKYQIGCSAAAEKPCTHPFLSLSFSLASTRSLSLLLSLSRSSSVSPDSHPKQ